MKWILPLLLAGLLSGCTDSGAPFTVEIDADVTAPRSLEIVVKDGDGTQYEGTVRIEDGRATLTDFTASGTVTVQILEGGQEVAFGSASAGCGRITITVTDRSAGLNVC